MIGAIAGDIIGSVYERHNIKQTDFMLFGPRCRFTDDTVLTVAVADAILTGSAYLQKLKDWHRAYPRAGYGPAFALWAASDSKIPYNSMGNGSAMRVSPVGWAFGTLKEVLAEAKRSAEVTHNHPEGIKGAQAVAAAVYLARTGASKDEVKAYVETAFCYNLDASLDSIREDYRHDVTCQGSVPQALRAFLEADDLEDAVRNAVSIGGDSDTIACIAGSVAHAFYGTVSDEIRQGVFRILDDPLKEIVHAFCKRYSVPM